MKILGIGVDVVNNRRIQTLIKNQNFIKRTFGPNELKSVSYTHLTLPTIDRV